MVMVTEPVIENVKKRLRCFQNLQYILRLCPHSEILDNNKMPKNNDISQTEFVKWSYISLKCRTKKAIQ